MLTFRSAKTMAIGEAMIEMSWVGDKAYRRSFAGDTFNTAWHMSQIPEMDLDVGYLSKVGEDKTSHAFIAELEADGLDTTWVGRVADRSMGLYLIELDGVERSFQYWRDQSAARLLAEDEAFLAAALEGVGLIHLSGITLGILTAEARARLCAALSAARKSGARVSFDPNIRPRLWSSEKEIRAAMDMFYAVTDIALPSFDDEAMLWGDASPTQTVARLQGAGIAEIAVKNGSEPVLVSAGSSAIAVATSPVSDVRDTSGAGDAFNAGYLAARLAGQAPEQAVASGQKMSAEVLRHFGARIPKGQVPGLAAGARGRSMGPLEKQKDMT